METELLKNEQAAQFLNRHLPERTPEKWMLWLQNNRNQLRKSPYRIPFERIGKEVFYDEAELQIYVEWEKGRRKGGVRLSGRTAELFQAMGLGENDGSAFGRKFKGGYATPQIAERSSQHIMKGNHFVQVGIKEPFLIFAMTPEEAISFGKELQEAGGYAKKRNEEK